MGITQHRYRTRKFYVLKGNKVFFRKQRQKALVTDVNKRGSWGADWWHVSSDNKDTDTSLKIEPERLEEIGLERQCGECILRKKREIEPSGFLKKTAIYILGLAIFVTSGYLAGQNIGDREVKTFAEENLPKIIERERKLVYPSKNVVNNTVIKDWKVHERSIMANPEFYLKNSESESIERKYRAYGIILGGLAGLVAAGVVNDYRSETKRVGRILRKHGRKEN